MFAIVGSFLVSYFIAKKHNKKYDNIFFLIFGLVFISAEIFKQIYLIESLEEYDWAFFPFQLCSMDLYLVLPCALMKEGKIKESILKFVAFSSLLGGTCVLAQPGMMFLTYPIPLIYHSLSYHSLMIILSIYIIVSRNYGFEYKEVLSASVVFIFPLVVAIILNEVMYYYLVSIGNTSCFNMFFINPHYQVSIIPMFDQLNPIFRIFVYFIGVIAAISLEFYIIKLIRYFLIKEKKHV